MKIKIDNGEYFEKVQKAFDGYTIQGHIEVAIDGVWFVVDSVKRNSDGEVFKNI